jgi:hypothetical protein
MVSLYNVRCKNIKKSLKMPETRVEINPDPNRTVWQELSGFPPLIQDQAEHVGGRLMLRDKLVLLANTDGVLILLQQVAVNLFKFIFLALLLELAPVRQGKPNRNRQHSRCNIRNHIVGYSN